jgi:hypothetical protein
MMANETLKILDSVPPSQKTYNFNNLNMDTEQNEKELIKAFEQRLISRAEWLKAEKKRTVSYKVIQPFLNGEYKNALIVERENGRDYPKIAKPTNGGIRLALITADEDKLIRETIAQKEAWAKELQKGK